MNTRTKKYLLAFILCLPVIYLYSVHFFYHDADHKPTGLIQWEHALYMISAKEYQSGNASILYQYPLAGYNNNPAVFFQPQLIVLGYLWKWTGIAPGILLSLFGLLFAFFTAKILVEIIYLLVPDSRRKGLLSFLFMWGGGILAICGWLLHAFYFKDGDISQHIFYLDPGDGWWCLNFGRSLIYPLEAYYHFLFITVIYCILKNKTILASGLLLLLTISHPYTATELMAIVAVWVTAEYFYFKNSNLYKKDILPVYGAILFYIIFYVLLTRYVPAYKMLTQKSSQDWGYKAWNFIPAYLLVWLLSFFAIKNIPQLKKHFSNDSNRLFFYWGTVAFLLTVHGFAIKPIQPLHFTRGYVYAGFFLFALTSITKLLDAGFKNTATKLVTAIAILIFLSDNLAWFYFNTNKNITGVTLDKPRQELIGYFKTAAPNGWIVDASGNDHETAAMLQLYTPQKGWIVHELLTPDKEQRDAAIKNLLSPIPVIDEEWKQRPLYLYSIKNNVADRDSVLHFPLTFENQKYRVYKIN
ncbi:hypothetical protein [Ferruginibacter sp.]